jgi:hypothetical protein
VRPSGAASATAAHDRGASLIGLLVVLVVLGATAAIVVAALPTTSSVTLPTTSTTHTTGGRGTTTTTSRTIVSAALIAACVADVQAVASAAQTYATLNGAPPPAGTSWATAAVKGGPFLHSWPSAPGQFAVRWDGATVVVTPAHGQAAQGSPGTATPATGCYAA